MLVVDDSSLMRKLIRKMVEEDPDITVVDTAMNGIFALKKIETRDPDVILLDIEMPEMNGVEFLEKCRELGIEIPIIVLSSLGKNRPELTTKCLTLGAKDFIIKPSGTISMDIELVKEEVNSKIKFFHYELTKQPFKRKGLKKDIEKLISPKEKQRVTIKTELLPRVEKPKKIAESATIGLNEKLKNIDSIEAVTIGISTGGPYALRKIIPLFPASFPLPILIVQHMPSGFTYEFSKGLDEISPTRVKEAEDGDKIEKGNVYIAPGNRHLIVKRYAGNIIVSLSDSPHVCGHRPSAEVLFDSAITAYGNRMISVIMTGMGKDGARGIKRVSIKGGITLAQSERTCVVFGMPKVAVDIGGIDEIVDLDDIPYKIMEFTSMFYSNLT